MTADQRRALALASLLAAAGVTHFARPRPYDAIVPRWIPGPPRMWTYASGAAELAVATAITCPRTRRSGGLAAASLFAAVFPANVQMAVDWRGRGAAPRAIAYARLPLQVPLVWWALKVATGAGRPSQAPAICRSARRPGNRSCSMLVCIKQLVQVTGEQPGRVGTFRTMVRLPFRRDTHAARLTSS